MTELPLRTARITLRTPRLAERLGMHREAHLCHDMWVKGEWTDTLLE